jgi:hypothetical protein
MLNTPNGDEHRADGDPERDALSEPDGFGVRIANAGFEHFIEDVRPFFFRRRLSYAEIGAGRGEAFVRLSRSRLAIGDVCLVESDPKRFAALKKSAPKSFPNKSLRIVADATPDEIASSFADGRIDLLRIAAHGSEDVILSGADALLRAHKIDIVYVEAEAEGRATLDELMGRYGYRLFRIYEQANEQPDDSPLLERLSLAYFSPAFSQSNPFRLSREAFALSEETRRLHREIATRDLAILDHDGALADRDALIAEARRAASKLERQLGSATKKLQQLETEVARKDAAVARSQAGAAKRDAAIAQGQAQIAKLDAAVQATRTALADARRLEAELRAQLDRAESGFRRQAAELERSHQTAVAKLVARNEAELAGLTAQAQSVSRANAALQTQISAMETSTSWRVTAPIRGAKRIAASLVARLKRAVSAARSRTVAPRLAPPSTVAKAGDPPAPTPAERAAAAAHAHVKALEDKLWGGFSRKAEADLEAVKTSPRSTPAAAAQASWALACWQAAEGELERAKHNAKLARQGPAANAQDVHRALLEAYCLVGLGEFAEAQALLAPFAARRPQDLNVRLALANAHGSLEPDPAADARRLELINAVLVEAGLAPLVVIDPAKGLGVANLATEPLPPAVDAERAKVSVIIPVFNAADTIAFTLESLLSQTWRNLEIVAVDDCSEDETGATIEAFAARDPRVILLRQARNQGSYAARNRGLATASGDFITVHDANDWSHPQKIERQAVHLLEHAEILANHSNWARVIEGLVFVGKFRRKDKIVDWNPSSFFFRRALLDRLGGWDRVRISADAELVRRAKSSCRPDERIRPIPVAAPLAFAFDTAASLTKHSATHGRTIHHGFRRAYHEAANHWRAQAERGALRLDPAATMRAFPAPGPILADREPSFDCDLLFIADFNLDGPDADATLRDIDAAAAGGRRVAIFHWRLYDKDVTAPLNGALRDRALRGEVRIVAPGEEVRADAVVVAGARVAEQAIDLCPRVAFRTLSVLTDRGPQPKDSAAARAVLKELFGTEGVWAPAADVLPAATPASPAPATADV